MIIGLNRYISSTFGALEFGGNAPPIKASMWRPLKSMVNVGKCDLCSNAQTRERERENTHMCITPYIASVTITHCSDRKTRRWCYEWEAANGQSKELLLQPVAKGKWGSMCRCDYQLLEHRSNSQASGCFRIFFGTRSSSPWCLLARTHSSPAPSVLSGKTSSPTVPLLHYFLTQSNPPLQSTTTFLCK